MKSSGKVCAVNSSWQKVQPNERTRQNQSVKMPVHEREFQVHIQRCVEY